MVIKFIRNHFWKFVFFCLVGVTAFFIDWAFFNLFYRISSLFVFSRTISAGISMIFNFNINRNITFKARGGLIKKQITRWFTVYFIAFLANVIVGKIVLITLGENLLNANIAFFAGVIVAIPISFLGSLLWAFRKSD
tara:strand:+ start:892 stop:1302 length:411 start_codon:yes stop_codon:yes gene_type:complete